MTGMQLAPGFRFHPSHSVLVMYYLKRKVMGKKCRFNVISELNINDYSPWDLPDKSCLKSKDREWYFFCPRERKYASGSRVKRAAGCGYWKTTGRERSVVYENREVGKFKTLVFHQGSPPGGQRTDWLIHEYRMADKKLDGAGVAQDTYVLCKLFQKDGRGPNNGAYYGALFNEEEYDSDSDDDDDDDNVVDPNGTLPFGSTSAAAATTTTVHLPHNASNSAVTSMVGCPAGTTIMSISEPGPSSTQPLVESVCPDLADYDIIQHLLNQCPLINPGIPDQGHYNEMLDNGLGDLDPRNWQALGDGGLPLPPSYAYSLEGGGAMHSFDFPMSFSPEFCLELNDFDAPLNFSAEDEALLQRLLLPPPPPPLPPSQLPPLG